MTDYLRWGEITVAADKLAATKLELWRRTKEDEERLYLVIYLSSGTVLSFDDEQTIADYQAQCDRLFRELENEEGDEARALSIKLEETGKLLNSLRYQIWNEDEYQPIPILVNRDGGLFTGALASAKDRALNFALHLVEYRGDQERATRIYKEIERRKGEQ